MYTQFTLTPANINTAGFATNVTGASFTLTANSSGDSIAHRITVLNNTATDHSGKTLTAVGTDQDGRAQTATFAAPGSSATVTSTTYWLTLTSLTPSSTIGADTFNIGWAGSFSGRTIPVDWRSGIAGLSSDITGTINYDIQQTFDDIQFKTGAFVWTVDNPATQAGVTADLTVLYEAHPKAIRFLCNSYSNGASVLLSYTQRDR